MALQQYIGQLSLTADEKDFTVGSEAISLTAGRYYIAGYSGEAASNPQLVEHMQTKIRASNYAYMYSTVVYSGVTGLVTIAFFDNYSYSLTAPITWNDAALQTLLGYTGSQTAAASHVATNTPKGVWRPSNSLADYPGDLAKWWLPNSTSVAHRAADGTVNTVQRNLIYEGRFEYEFLDVSEVVTDADTVWESFESFWTNVVHAGRSVRAYPDRGLNESTDYKEGYFAPVDSSENMIGDFRGNIAAFRKPYHGLWSVRFDYWKKV